MKPNPTRPQPGGVTRRAFIAIAAAGAAVTGVRLRPRRPAAPFRPDNTSLKEASYYEPIRIS